LPRLAYVAAGMLLAAAIAATVTSTILFVMLPQIDDQARGSADIA
jgi:hypothetical protein